MKIRELIVVLMVIGSVFSGIVSAENVPEDLAESVAGAEIQGAEIQALIANASSAELAKSTALDDDPLHQLPATVSKTDALGVVMVADQSAELGPIKSSSNLAEKAASLAEEVIGAPYLWGGKGWNWNPNGGWDWPGGKFVDNDGPSPSIKGGYYYYKPGAPNNVAFGKGLDCSGLIFWAFNKAAGKTKYIDPSNPIYYESASGQWSDTERFEQISTSIPSVSDLKTGYLLFLDTPDGGFGSPDHVGMYVGNGYVIHSRGGVGVEKKTLNDWLNIPLSGGKKYKDYFFGYGRVKVASGDKFNINVPVFKQCGQWYSNEQLGWCPGETICSAGCAVCSVAMIFKYYGVDTNPSHLNQWLKYNDGYESGCLIKWARAADISDKVSWAGIDYSVTMADIKAEIDAGYPCVGKESGRSHFFVIKGYSGSSTLYINDPYFSRTTIDVSQVERIMKYHGTAWEFNIGDTVQTTANLNVRTGPGPGYPEISDPDYPGYAPKGVTGVILDGPESADGYIWWKVEYDYDDDPYAEYTGWSAQDWLEIVPLKFDIGDTVQTTANLNVRTGPGVSYYEITDPDYPGYAPKGVTGVILDGPKSAEDDGYIWWKVEYDAGYTGWSAQDWLETVSAPDTTPPPPPTISSPTHPNENIWYNNNDPSFTWTTPSDSSGIAGYSYILDHSSSTTPDTSIDTTGNSKSYTNLADGIWYFHVRAKDNAGNWGSADHYRVKIDTAKPPAPSPDDGVEGWSNDNTPTFSWNKPRDTSGIAGYYWKVDSGSEKWTTSTSVTLPAQSDGEHTFYVKAKDNAGNIGDYGSHKFKIDTTPPSSEVKELPEVQTSTTFTVSWEGSDALSGIKWYDVQYKKDDGSWTDWLTHTTLTSEQFTGECGHTYYFRCRAEDNAGNWEDYGEADTYTYINCPPNKPSNPYPPNGATNVPIDTSLSWSCSDPDGDALKYDIYLGTSIPPPLVMSDHTSTTYDPILENNTTYYWKVVAKDEHGAKTEGDIWSFTTAPVSVENQPPVASFTYSPQHPKVNENITFNASLSYDPDGTIVKYEWDFGDGNITNTTHEIINHSYSEAGIYEVTLTVTDDKGATNSTTKMITVMPAPPSVSISTDKYEYTAGDIMLINITIKNPSERKSVKFLWCLDITDYDKHFTIINRSLLLPAFYDKTFTLGWKLPELKSSFNASWHVAIFNTTTSELISEDYADWKYAAEKAKKNNVKELEKSVREIIPF